MRLIDADALPKYTGYALSADAVATAVENAPTIEVVRCRDCKNWITVFDRTKAEYGLCKLEVTRYNDFCSRGERRTDEVHSNI